MTDRGTQDSRTTSGTTSAAKAADDYTPSAGLGYLFASLGMFLLSAVLADVSAEEQSVVLAVAAVLTAVVATYFLIVGAVARGLQVARHKLSAERTTTVGRTGQDDPGAV
ncbi:hypothetical protein ACFP3Q_07185 [Nocardioides sp. GCM10027113]|uniref:hypothetical protein n=1 Tax=unclassified Nocardioides TaxID=2615069 RepID=UPI0036076387